MGHGGGLLSLPETVIRFVLKFEIFKYFHFQVTLPCRVENKIGVIQWTRDGFGLGDTRDLSGYSRYKLIGSDDESRF